MTSSTELDAGGWLAECIQQYHLKSYDTFDTNSSENGAAICNRGGDACQGVRQCTLTHVTNFQSVPQVCQTHTCSPPGWRDRWHCDVLRFILVVWKPRQDETTRVERKTAESRRQVCKHLEILHVNKKSAWKKGPVVVTLSFSVCRLGKSSLQAFLPTNRHSQVDQPEERPRSVSLCGLPALSSLVESRWV